MGFFLFFRHFSLEEKKNERERQFLRNKNEPINISLSLSLPLYLLLVSFIHTLPWILERKTTSRTNVFSFFLTKLFWIFFLIFEIIIFLKLNKKKKWEELCCRSLEKSLENLKREIEKQDGKSVKERWWVVEKGRIYTKIPYENTHTQVRNFLKKKKQIKKKQTNIQIKRNLPMKKETM